MPFLIVNDQRFLVEYPLLRVTPSEMTAVPSGHDLSVLVIVLPLIVILPPLRWIEVSHGDELNCSMYGHNCATRLHAYTHLNTHI